MKLLPTFRNPLSSNAEIGVVVVAALAVAGGAWWWLGRGTVVSLTPGVSNVSAKAGSTVRLVLPSAATWKAVASGGESGVALTPASGSAPYPVANVSNGEIINATWTDGSGQLQNATITVQAS